jgi:hypothetical protein
MSAPSRGVVAASVDNVRTTPLTWGCHASVATRIRIKRLRRSNAGFGAVFETRRNMRL